MAEMTRTVFDEIVGNVSKARLGIYLPPYLITEENPFLR